MVYIVDTHTLVWYLTGSKQLSKKAERILKKSKVRIIIPTIVLAELKYLHHRQKIPLSLEKIRLAINEDERCIVFPLNEDVVDLLPTELDIHDGIICATAMILQKTFKKTIVVITKDKEIKGSKLVRTLW